MLAGALVSPPDLQRRLDGSRLNVFLLGWHNGALRHVPR
jgi:hypothetical protein